MPVIHITKTNIERLDKPTEGRVDYFDDVLRGFGVRVSPTVKTYFTMRRVNGKLVRAKIDTADKVTAEQARKRAEGMLSDMGKGHDPNEHKREKVRLAEDKAMEITVAKLCTEYIERHAKKFKRSWETDERILNHDVIPAWGKRRAADIVKRDVVLLLEKIVDRGSPVMANNTFAVIRKMFNFAVERDILPHTPCYGVKPPAPKVSRERALSEAEIKTFWSNLDGCAMSAEIMRALKLILTTAQRPGEVIGMHTSEIDGEWWTIPAERAKNKKTHRVYLSALARGIIAEAIDQAGAGREVPADQEYSGFVFPTPHTQKVQSIAGQALIVAVSRGLASPVLDAKGKPLFDSKGIPATVNKIGVDHFTPHDLRRTAATFMAQSGEMDEVIDAILNHAKQGVIKVYNQFKYDAQKQLALESWARKLAAITTGTESNVIPLRRKAAGAE
jgi:integrase